MEIYDTTGCSTLAKAHSDPIFATAPTSNDTWFLLEWDEDWRADAISAASLPESIAEWWNQTLPAIPQSRRLFIRSKKSSNDARSFIVVVSQPSIRFALEFQWRSPDELLMIDIERALKGEYEDSKESPWVMRLKEPFMVVCANHQHDRCCARGHAVCEAMSSEGIRAFETTHIGGHRYAATGIVFPVGQYYGLLSPAIVKALARAIREDHILLDHFRGWVCHAPEVQAADYFLRKEQGFVRRTDLVFVESSENGESGFRVCLEVRPSLQLYEINVRKRDVGSRVVSCGPSSNKSKNITAFECEGIRLVSGRSQVRAT